MFDYVNNWHRVWSHRSSVLKSIQDPLQQLIALNGFDSPLGAMSANDWKKYLGFFVERCGIAEADSIFEVGCGSGAFLYPLYMSGHQIGGLDYSKELVELAKSHMADQQGSISAIEAKDLCVEPFVDVVVANHVFHYFESLRYSEMVLSKMLRKARKSVWVSGVPDADLREESEKVRRGLLSPEEYESKYAGLDILYFDRSFFSDLAMKHKFNIIYFPHEMPGFAQNHFRYDCLMVRA